jgi:uncharacterized protein YjbJ (UPF0337 family)
LCASVRRRTEPIVHLTYRTRAPLLLRVVNNPEEQFKEPVMGINKDQVKGRAEEVQGKAKEVVGKVVGNKDLEVKGNIQKNVGAVQARVGDAKSDIEKAVRKA